MSDKTTVFYQGTDIDAAMGIAVFGNKVYVSAYTKIFVFTDTNGDDKPDKKEVLFTASGPADHDHSTHAFVFGPDGRLYFNGGNETRSLMDSAGNVIVDRAGYRVEAKREPYQEGMAFRLEPDATKFEVLGYNFRNPYELAVDSYGTVWQTDNDDDGNRSTRLNYVMEGGNFGYRDEMTGAYWRVRRTNMEPEIPRQHWHSADPGSVPNVRINGAGSPSGVAVYEGALLPKQYHGTILHADPGVERGARVLDRRGRRGLLRRATADRRVVEGQDVPPGRRRRRAGRLAVRRRLVRRGRGRPQHVRPVAGTDHPHRAAGHRATRCRSSTSRRRRARRARCAARTSPRANSPTRRLAAYGRRAEAPLAAMWRGTVPHDRARALWLLARIPGRGARYLDDASRDADPNIRITALRATRRIGGDVIAHGRAARARSLARGAPRGGDRAAAQPEPARRGALGRPRAAVRRTRSLVPRGARRRGATGSGTATSARGSTASATSGTRRPAATSCGAHARRARCRCSRSSRAIRRRPSPTACATSARSTSSRPEARQKSLLALLATPAGASAELTPVILGQLDAKTAGSVPEVQAALQRTLAASRGTSQYVELVDRYGVRTEMDELVRLALARPNETVGAEAARLAISWGGMPRFAALVRGADDMAARRALAVLGRNFTAAADTIMTGVVLDAIASTRSAPVGRAVDGRRTRGAAPAARARARWPSPGRAQARGQRRALLGAAEHPRLGGAVSHPARRDDARRQDTPAAHRARRAHGRRRRRPPRVRPRRARCVTSSAARAPTSDRRSPRSATSCRRAGFITRSSIRAPAISFGYEGWTIKTRDGQQLIGMIASETDDEVVMRLIGGIQRRVPKSTIAERKRMDTSLMPQGLERAMNEADLVNLVEYLSTLRRQR